MDGSARGACLVTACGSGHTWMAMESLPAATSHPRLEDDASDEDNDDDDSESPHCRKNVGAFCVTAERYDADEHTTSGVQDTVSNGSTTGARPRRQTARRHPLAHSLGAEAMPAHSGGPRYDRIREECRLRCRDDCESMLHASSVQNRVIQDGRAPLARRNTGDASSQARSTGRHRHTPGSSGTMI